MKTEIANFKPYLERHHPNRSTTKHYVNDLSIFSDFVGERSPREISVKTIDAFVQAQSDHNLKPATINRRLSAISSFFEYLIAEAEDDTWRNPVRWKRHAVQPGHHLPRDVSDETADRLLASMDDVRDYAMFSLMLKAGLRVGEVVTLSLDQLEIPDQGHLARLRVHGKGDKERTVWLTQETWLCVQAWLAIRPASQSQALFLNQHARPLSVSGVQFRLKRYTQRLDTPVTCHQLRHTFARRLAEHEMPVDSLAKLLGHSGLQTTQLYIDGADPRVRRDFHAAMQPVLAGPEATPTGSASLLTSPPAMPTPPPADERPDPEALLERLSYLTAELPDWLAQEVRQHTRRRMGRWQAHRLERQTYSHLNTLRQVCRALVSQRDWTALDQLQRADLVAYVNSRLEAGVQPRSIEAELIVFRAFWRDLLDQERVTNGAILRVKAPKSGQALPRYLTATEFERLQAVVQAETQADQPYDRLTQAWFYLLAHAGLRSCELLNLRLSDCDLSGYRLRIRGGKGNQDRVVPMTDQLGKILHAYLAVREPAPTDHLLIYRGAALDYNFISNRLRRFGQQAGIQPMSAHRLRHTLATMLVNHGMPITSLQKFLGHRDINMTLIYARVFDETVRQQFTAAMAQIERIAVANWLVPSNASAEALSMPTGQICDSV
jgi:site-specific recombinase XerD